MARTERAKFRARKSIDNVDWNQFCRNIIYGSKRGDIGLSTVTQRSLQIAEVNVLMSPLRRVTVLFINMENTGLPPSLSLSLVLFAFIALS